jgi:micrococcal nuclease
MRLTRIPAPRWLRRLRSRLVWVLVAIVGIPAVIDAGLGQFQPVQDGAARCRILQVVDGDTLRLWCEGGVARMRLTGIDTPEAYSPQCFGEFVAAQQATWALRGMILRADDLRITRAGTDRFRRPLVTLGDAAGSLTDRMIAAGHGRAYDGGRRNGWCGG